MAFTNYTFGQATLEGFLQGRKMSQEEDQFKQKLAQDARQESLMNIFRQQTAQREQQHLDLQLADEKRKVTEFDTKEADKWVTVTKDNPYRLKEGKYIKTFMDDVMRQNKDLNTPYRTSDGKEFAKKQNEVGEIVPDFTKPLYIPDPVMTPAQQITTSIAQSNEATKKETAEDKRSIAQTTYNSVMATPVKQKKDGSSVYEYRENNGDITEYTTNEELERRALQEASKHSPKINAWKRSSQKQEEPKKEDTKQTPSDPLGLK